jgi:hypothetical protein
MTEAIDKTSPAFQAALDLVDRYFLQQLDLLKDFLERNPSAVMALIPVSLPFGANVKAAVVRFEVMPANEPSIVSVLNLSNDPPDWLENQFPQILLSLRRSVIPIRYLLLIQYPTYIC